MTGKYYLKLKNNVIEYDLEITSGITILRGDSSSGKSEFSMFLQRAINGVSKGISTSEYDTNFKRVVVTRGVDLVNTEDLLKNTKDALIVIDEDNQILHSGRLGKMIKEGVIDSYLLLITRIDFGDLAYSIDSIYQFVKEGVLEHSKKAFTKNTLRKLFLEYDEKVIPQVVFSEDSGCGEKIYNAALSIEVIGLKSKDKIKSGIAKYLRKNKEVKNLGIIIDKSGFGANVYNLLAYKRELWGTRGIRLVVYSPESFEYLVLKSNIFEISNKYLKEPYLYADFSLHTSFETYYTSMLKKAIKNTYGDEEYKKGLSNGKAFDKMVENSCLIVSGIEELREYLKDEQ